MSDERITQLEMQTAHQTRILEELNDVVTQHGREIDILTRRLRVVMERLAEHDLATGDTAPGADQKPPHW
ncbi:MAG: SlyX family protein [Rhodobacterales bacterium]|jgi:SlyX protein|nr:SlyX family protein [Pseudomonadota bacterium]MDA1286862.1 SlyX family protein [Pseudomonadota bacterium]NQW12983.1 SlyX family protein [Rhodobacter sp.]